MDFRGYKDYKKYTSIEQPADKHAGAQCGPCRWGSGLAELFTILQLAINNLSVVPCVGRTEQFENDVKGFEDILADYQHPFKYTAVNAENVTSSDHNRPIETQLSSIENNLSKKIWEKLKWLNHQDIGRHMK